MRKALFLLPMLAVMFGLLSTQSANAQVTPIQTSSPTHVIELTNATGCDYIVQFHYTVFGVWGMHQVNLPPSGSDVVFYDPLTTQVQFIEATNLITMGGAAVLNPAYPGFNSALPMSNGCTLGEVITWENFNWTLATTHIANVIIFP